MNQINNTPKLALRRERYQQGSLTTEKRNIGPDVWVYRWRESAGNGKTVKRKFIVGNVKEYPTETAARRAVDALRLDINALAVSTSQMTVRELVEHYKLVELGDGCPKPKTRLTREVYRHHLDNYIVPRWGKMRLGAVIGTQVEKWLQSLIKVDGSGEPAADATKAKVKAVFGVVYQHAMRNGWADRNPLREVRQSAKRRCEPDTLTPEEVTALLSALPAHARTMVAVAAVTGLRRGELVGLKWADIDFENRRVHIRRSLVDHVEGGPKTEMSGKPLPLDAALAKALRDWQKQTSFVGPDDWVFASPYNVGRTPYWPGTVLAKVIRPAARSAGVAKRLGWHTFRRSVASWLVANGETVKTSQELMRHATPTMTLGTYAQAIDGDKRTAQGRITAMLGLGSGEQAASA